MSPAASTNRTFPRDASSWAWRGRRAEGGFPARFSGKELVMRLLVRTATWVLAAVGIKALYDRLVPKARDLREPASQVLDTAKSSSRELADHAKAAGTEVLADARDRSVNIREVATDAMARTDSAAKAPKKSGSAGSTNKASKH